MTQRVSGWCNGHQGCTSERAHETCADRIRRGLLTACACEAFQGHPTTTEDPN